MSCPLYFLPPTLLSPASGPCLVGERQAACPLDFWSSSLPPSHHPTYHCRLNPHKTSLGIHITFSLAQKCSVAANWLQEKKLNSLAWYWKPSRMGPICVSHACPHYSPAHYICSYLQAFSSFPCKEEFSPPLYYLLWWISCSPRGSSVTSSTPPASWSYTAAFNSLTFALFFFPPHFSLLDRSFLQLRARVSGSLHLPFWHSPVSFRQGCRRWGVD